MFQIQQTAKDVQDLKEDIYNDNLDTMEDALKNSTMSLRGVIGEDVCDAVGSSLVEADAFCLAVFECFELVCVNRKHCLPDQKKLFEVEGVGDTDTELFFLQCKCCHGRLPDGSLDPTASVLVKESKACAVKMTAVVFGHLLECLSGDQLNRFKLLSIDPANEPHRFKQFAAEMHVRAISLILWIRQISHRKFILKGDKEVWRSMSSDELKVVLDAKKTLPLADLMGRKKRKGAPGSAVLEWEGFPVCGVLHGNTELPCNADLKMSRVKRVRRSSKTPSVASSRVDSVESFPPLELPIVRQQLLEKSSVIVLDDC